MAVFAITIEDTGESFRCSSDESLLSGMERLGKRGIPVGCRGGGCGVCKVRIAQGDYRKRVMSREHITPEDEARGVVLACRVRPLSDIRLSVVGGMKKKLCAPAIADAENS
ncbi:MAG: 2Fe-2S iron-sulfur cluster binding domain-containing protein [Dechloromonas sp.]|nr:2Fe-2S iron-sulfur cluster binding domain-containing protein [Dechloromonas sp.]